jgi:hypothetical protein
VRLLLDSHIFLWYISADPQLPAAFRDAIRDPANEVYLSVASVWEAVIKYALGKLPLSESVPEAALDCCRVGGNPRERTPPVQGPRGGFHPPYKTERNPFGTDSHPRVNPEDVGQLDPLAS